MADFERFEKLAKVLAVVPRSQVRELLDKEKSVKKKKQRKKRASTESKLLKMSDVGCTRLWYRITVALDKFHLKEFKDGLRVDDITSGSHTCAPKNPETSDYHVHFKWRVKEKDILIDVDYYKGVIKPEPNEREPYAEDVIGWLGQFFRYADTSAQVHVDFKFRGVTQQWFPLPLRTRIEALNADAQIDGITVSLPSEPNGITRIYLTRDKESLSLGLGAEERLVFSEFSVPSKLRLFHDIAKQLVEVPQ